MTITDEEIKQNEEQHAVEDRVSRWFDKVNEQAGGFGHAPYFVPPRVKGWQKLAQELVVGDQVRVRYFDYEAHKNVVRFAGIDEIEVGPGCPWNGAVPLLAYMLLMCPDGNYRFGRASRKRPVEVA